LAVADLGQAQHFKTTGQQLETLIESRHQIVVEDILSPSWRRDRSRRDRPTWQARSSPHGRHLGRNARQQVERLAHLFLQVEAPSISAWNEVGSAT
jgi:hypothetical protein